MPRPYLFIAALIAGASYCLAERLVAPGAMQTTWKGAGVGLLALWAAGLARGRDGWLLAAVLALGATGDVLLEVAGLTVGAMAFLAGHVVAIVLYRRHPRPSGPGRGVAALLLVGTPFVGGLLGRDAGVTLYAAGLGAMAASAWSSRFPRRSVGSGAILFVLSDLLIFARGGVLADSRLPDLLIWPTYFAGQALIAWGVAMTLEGDG